MRHFNFKDTNNMGEVMIRLNVDAGLRQLGEQAPYFTITGKYRNYYDETESCGCIHDKILQYFPQLEDFVRFHCRHMDGSPMYPVENGWYFVQNHKVSALADHLLVTEEEAQKVIDDCSRDKEAFVAVVKSHEDRWKAEADALIKKYKLKIDKE